MGGSRRGSLIPGRSRQGSIALGGPDRASVAMVTDDPEHKKNLKAALAGAFNDATISKYNVPFFNLLHIFCPDIYCATVLQAKVTNQLLMAPPAQMVLRY